MSTAYTDIEAGIKETLLPAVPDEHDGSPFKTVTTSLAGYSDDEIAVLIETVATANTAPAALVLYAGGEVDANETSAPHEEAEWAVVVVDAARNQAAAVAGDEVSPGIFALMDYVRDKLHNAVDIEGIVNPLLFIGNRRLRAPNRPLSAAAYMVRFKVLVVHPDRPQSGS